MNGRDWRTLQHLGRDPVVPLAVAERVAHERDRLGALLQQAEAELRSQRSALASRTEEAHRLEHAVDVLRRQHQAAITRIEQLERELPRAANTVGATQLEDLTRELERLRSQAEVFRDDAHKGWAQVELAQAEAARARQEADLARDEIERMRAEHAAAATPVQAPSAEEAEHEASEWRRRAQGYAADLANVRRRERDEIEAGVRRERIARLQSLAAIYDIVARSLSTSTLPEDDPWMQGTLLTRNRLLQEMALVGARPFGAAGDAFDPHRHEAIATLPGGTPNTVAQVLEVGFAFADGFLVRPARVAVHSPA